MSDPATGLPTDEFGQILGAVEAGSNIISDHDQESYLPPPGPITSPSQVSTPESHPAANIPMPGETTKTNKQVQGSYRGITQGGLAATTSLNNKADAAARSDVAQFTPEWEAEKAEASRIADERRTALRDETAAIAEHSQRESEIWRAQQGFIKEQHDLEKHAYAQSQVVRQQYLANYENDLLTAKMLAMQSGDPYERMSGGQAFGLIAAHAVQGFLKVGGHNIDVASQTDRWVNREIAKHSQKVQDARAAANDGLHLYDLARQGAHDDYEARERYRGMVMEGMKAQLQVEAGRFGSQIASATAQQKAAEIDAQLLAVKTNLADKMQKTYFDAQQMRINQAAEQARNSVAWYQAKTGRMEEDRKAKEAKEQKAPEVIGDIEYTKVFDKNGQPMRDGAGKPLMVPKQEWTIKDDPDAKKGARGARNRWAHYEDRWKEVMRLRDEAYQDLNSKGALGMVALGSGAWGASRASEKFRQYQAAKKEFVRAQLTDESGKTVTDKEAEDKAAQYPDEKIFSEGTGTQIFINMRENKRRDFEREMETYSTGQAKRTASPGAAADYRNSQSEIEGQESPVSTEAAKAREGSDTAATEPGKYHAAYRGFLAQESLNAGAGESEYAVHMDKLAKLALDPFSEAKRLQVDPNQLAKDALTSLENIGRDTSLPALRRKYADYLSFRLIEEPDQLASDLEHTGLEFK